MSQDILSLDEETLTATLHEWGHPGYRARQVQEWIYKHHACDFSSMRNLPAGLRRSLESGFHFPRMTLERVLTDPGSKTSKLLITLEDGERVEVVVLGNKDRATTLCVSSQVGCAMGCVFCATGLMGIKRSMTREEILFQIQLALAFMTGHGYLAEKPNIVFMGMGEPLLNRRAVFAALAALVDPDRYGIGQRRITVSTVGVLKGIEEFTALPFKVNLAFSLHSADSKTRDVLVPHVKSSLAELMQALVIYARKTGRLVTFEYVLLKDRNDSREDATKLADLIDGFDLPSLVNLIPFNPVSAVPFESTPADRVLAFKRVLEHRGVKATIRRTQGEAIDAACGQLALRGYQETMGQAALRADG